MDALAHLLNETNNLELRQTFINHSVVVARTQEGTLVRKIDALEVFNIPDMEMLIGAFAWQHKCNEMIEGQLQPVLKWRFTVDEGKHTFRHYDFAVCFFD
uniref:Uncharacterized protein n=1 Tax=Panagrolaimus superbus TaxID=310955 RepID=A0A914YM42_9BILA